MWTKNQKITSTTMIAIIAIVLASTPMMYEKTATAGNTVHLAVKEISSVPQGTISIPVTDPQLSTLPSFSNAIKEADKIFSSIPTCVTPCPPTYRAKTQPDSFVAGITPEEAKLALSIMGFHDIPRPGQTVVDIHGTTIEYGGKYYSIVIMGI